MSEISKDQGDTGVNVLLRRGDTFRLSFAFVDQDGEAISLADTSLYFKAGASLAADADLLDLDIDNGITVRSESGGTFSVLGTASQMTTAKGLYPWHLVAVFPNLDRYTCVSGALCIDTPAPQKLAGFGVPTNVRSGSTITVAFGGELYLTETPNAFSAMYVENVDTDSIFTLRGYGTPEEPTIAAELGGTDASLYAIRDSVVTANLYRLIANGPDDSPGIGIELLADSTGYTIFDSLKLLISGSDYSEMTISSATLTIQ